MKQTNHGQTKTVVTSTLLMELMENHWRTLVYRSKSPITTFKFLMSKFLFASEEDFTEEDRTALWMSWEKAIQLCAVEPKFKEKHFHYLWLTRGVLQSLNNEITVADRKAFLGQLRSSLSHGRGYFAASVYYGIKNQGKKLYELFLKTRFPRKFPQKRHVGVGYNDKGTAKDSASDGSPHWTEVAMSGNREDWTESRSEKSDKLFGQLLIHTSQQIGGKKGIKNTRVSVPVG